MLSYLDRDAFRELAPALDWDAAREPARDPAAPARDSTPALEAEALRDVALELDAALELEPARD